MIRTHLLAAAAIAAVVIPAHAQPQGGGDAPQGQQDLTGNAAPPLAPAGQSAQAPDAAEPGVGEIVVTANRREQNLQDVGISITAFTGDQLRSLGVQTAADVAQITPNFEVIRSYAAPGFNTQFTIRGVGQPDFQDTTEATTTSYVDEFYMIGAGQADFLSFDMARTEVARGPQGTVQGRNATAGSVNFYTNRPDPTDVSGRVSVSAGDFGLFRSDAFLNVPVSDRIAVRAAFALDRADGYIRNVNPQPLWRRGGGNDFLGVRLQALLKPSETLTVVLKGEYADLGPVTAQNEKIYPTGPIPGRVGTFPQPADGFGQTEENTGQGPIDNANSDGPYLIGHKMWHFLGRAEWRASSDLSLVVVGGWLRSKKFEVEDCDHTPLPICLFSNRARSEHSMVEARLNYAVPRFRATVGANYLEQTISTRSATPLFFSQTISPFPTGLYVQAFRDTQTLESVAVFGQAEYDLTPRLTIIGGVRYTHDRKELDSINAVKTDFPFTTPPPATLDQFLAFNAIVLSDPGASFTTLNGQLNGDLAVFSKPLINANVQLNYKPTDDILLYAAYRRGVKSGGWITGNVAGTPVDIRKFREETNNAFELGAKTTLFGGRARLNGSVFYYDYENMQNTSLIGITNVITNNQAYVYGGELELASNPVRGLTVNGGIGIIDTEVKGINNPTGAVAAVLDNRLPIAPSFTGNYLVRYDFGLLSGTAFVQSSGRGRTFMFRDSLNNQATRIPGIFMADAEIGYSPASERWRASLFLRNVFDRRTPVNLFDLSGLAGSGERVFSLPRWFGGTVSVNF